MSRICLAAFCCFGFLACASAPPARTPGGPEDPTAPSTPVPASSTTLAATEPAPSAPPAQVRPSSGADADGGMPMMDMPGMDMPGMHHQMHLADGGTMDMPGMKMGDSDGGTQMPTHRTKRRHKHGAEAGTAAPDAGAAHGHHHMKPAADGGASMMDMPGMQMNGGAP